MDAAPSSSEEGSLLPSPLTNTALNGRPQGHARRSSRHKRWASVALAILLLSFVLTCLLSVASLLLLRAELADAQQRIATLERLVAGSDSSLASSDTLSRTLTDAQAQVAGLQRDLRTANALMNVAGQPLGAVSQTVRGYQLLVRIGDDLSTAASEGLSAAQSLVAPLESSAHGAKTAVGLTPSDVQSIRDALATANARVADAVSAYRQLDPTMLPAQLRPGTRDGDLLARLPSVPGLLDEAQQLLDIAPALLGVGQPAHYLVLLMDRTELRPGGGFQGNFGILELQGGKPSQANPFALEDTYQLDQRYYQNPAYQDSTRCPASAGLSVTGPQPPDLYWWWPFRCFSNQYGWGLRDANLSPDFPTNARTAIQIAEDSGTLPANTALAGVIAITPTLVEDVLDVTGPMNMSAYQVTITADNLEQEIHEFQLGARQPSQQDRKVFTHDLGAALLARLQHLNGTQARQIVKLAQQALLDKDLQVYFADARAEQLLREHELASEIAVGGGDGFFVVDTNDGGNKANAFVTERQTDIVTLLPDGGALHHLQIAVTYDKRGSVYQGTTRFQEYSDVQRTYLPGDATIQGYTQPAPIYSNDGCGNLYTGISDCTPGHRLDASAPLTQSDVPGRAMVMEPLIVPCGRGTDPLQYSSLQDNQDCTSDPLPHTVTVYVQWYTPGAYTVDASGRGVYSERIEKQPGTTLSLPDGQHGSMVHVAVYLSTSQDTALTDATFAQLLASATKIYDAPLVTDTVVHYALPSRPGA